MRHGRCPFLLRVIVGGVEGVHVRQARDVGSDVLLVIAQQAAHFPRVRLRGGKTDPALDRRSAPVAADKADGPAQFPLQFLDEEITDGGKFGGLLRRANDPDAPGRVARHELEGIVALVFIEVGTSDVVERLQRGMARHQEKPDLRVGGLGHFGGAVLGQPQGKLHVRLAGTEPDVADQHVGESDGVLCPHGQGGRGGLGGQRGQVGAPLPVGASRRGGRLPTQRHGHLFPGSAQPQTGILTSCWSTM